MQTWQPWTSPGWGPKGTCGGLEGTCGSMCPIRNGKHVAAPDRPWLEAQMAYVRGLGPSHEGPTLGSSREVLLLYGGDLMGPCGGPGTHPWGPDLWSELSSNSTDGTRGDTGPTAGRPAGWA